MSPERLWDRPSEGKGSKGVTQTKGKLRLKSPKVVRFFNFAFRHSLLIYPESEIWGVIWWAGFLFFNLL